MKEFIYNNKQSGNEHKDHIRLSFDSCLTNIFIATVALDQTRKIEGGRRKAPFKIGSVLTPLPVFLIMIST